MKALILAGGSGTRLKPLTNTTTKQLLPLANKPILHYIMNIVKEAGIKDTGIIVSKEWGWQVKQAIGDGSKWDTRVTFIVQQSPAGLAHATKLAIPFLEKSPFLMILGDNVYKIDIKNFLSHFYEKTMEALLLVKEVENSNRFGTAELDTEGKVVRVLEKSQVARSNLALAGVYIFSPAIFEAICNIKPSPRGELEITDAIQYIIETNGNVRAHLLDGWWLDTGDAEDMLRANRTVLEELLQQGIKGKVDSRSKLIGKIAIHHGTRVKNTNIIGPVAIAEECLIRDSFIGPFVSINKGTVINCARLENAIILEDCYLYGLKNMKDSLVGNNSKIIYDKVNSDIISLKAGDNTEIHL